MNHMLRRRSRKSSSRRSPAFSRWTFRLRLFWDRIDKTPLIVLSIAGLLVTGFGFILHSMYMQTDERRNLTCLALNVYFEARGEPEAGQYAVAEVTMNRVASPFYPDTVCEVVYQKNWDTIRKRYVSAFSWTEFSSMPEPRGKEWRRAQKIAEDVYYGRRAPMLAGALHYHADNIEPSWSKEKTRVATIGSHVFYK